MARELGGEAPLVENEATSKRLVREDENGGSDDDEDEKRINFSGVKIKSQRQKIAEEIGQCVTQFKLSSSNMKLVYVQLQEPTFTWSPEKMSL